ncbi:hypothetical protein K439DRAFT_1632711, partial [Ramaria rubella]
KGKGIKELLTYLLPCGYTIPSHQTVRRDLDILYEQLDKKVNDIIQKYPSKLAIASDLWTSKNSVYAFAGSEWELVEVVLELVALDVANGTNNASSNGVMNRAISKRARKAHGLHLDPDTMGVGCTAHAFHLIVQAILHALSLAPSPEDHDLYENACEHLLAYDPTTDPSVVEESKLHAQETKADAEGHSDMIIDLSDASDEVKVIQTAEASQCSKSDSRHCLLGTEAQVNAPTYSSIRGMPMCWNTWYAEIDQAIKLKPAINQWIDQLDQCVTGRKKKNDWFLTPGDWDMLDRLCGILKRYLIRPHLSSQRLMYPRSARS